MHNSLDYHANKSIIVNMKRHCREIIKRDLGKKMVFLTGPRQVGKTYLAKDIACDYRVAQYLNYDNIHDQKIMHEQSWRLDADLIILDEIHKMKDWKVYLKGVYDGKPEGQALLVTGSARMDTFRQSGESLAGRYFHHRLYPLSVSELSTQMSPAEALAKLNALGGFPEPFLSGQETEAARWRSQYYTDLVREDILDFGRLHEIRAMRMLLEMLRVRVGSRLSYTSLAEDLKIAPNTVRKYIEILESLYVVFMVHPYHRNISRAIQKEPKLYFFDSGFVQNEAARLENTVAVCLKKHVDCLADAGRTLSLSYLRTKEKKEVDFAIVENGELKTMLEIKTSDSVISAPLRYFKDRIDGVDAFQLVQLLRQPVSKDGISVVNAAEWLAGLEA